MGILNVKARTFVKSKQIYYINFMDRLQQELFLE